MKAILLALGMLAVADATHAQTSNWQPPADHTQVAIWPGTPPDAVRPSSAETLTTGSDLIAGRPYSYISNVTRPTMTVYPPKGRNTGAAVVVFPGGGYRILAIDLEGSEVCDWLVSRGIACVLLKYRVPDSGPAWHDDCRCNITPAAPTALEDAQRTIGLVRHRAAEWGIDPRKIGVLGFSAGGHLVADVSTHVERRAYTPVDAADRESSRPDFAVALYPGHMGEHTTRPFELNPTLPVTSHTPPTFIAQAEDDSTDGVDNALIYFIALKKAGVPAELHIYAHGGHAFGLRPTKDPITHWPDLMEKWLGTIGVLAGAPQPGR